MIVKTGLMLLATLCSFQIIAGGSTSTNATASTTPEKCTPFKKDSNNCLVRQKGPIDLVNVHDKSSKNNFSVEVNALVKGTITLTHEMEKSNHVVNAKAEFKNHTKGPINVAYYLSLTDKDIGLICSTNGVITVKPDKKIYEFDSASMPIPIDQFKDISYYEIIVYAAEKSIGSE